MKHRPDYTLWDCVSVTMAMARRALDEVRALSRMPGPKGDPGLKGDKGEPGKSGEDAKVDMAEVERLIEEAVERKAASFTPTPGPRGDPGKDGRDGFNIEDMSLEQVGERDFIVRFTRGDVVKENRFTLPGFVYQGVWREGQYAAGDAVQWGGSLFIADKATTGKPEVSPDWRLAVKRGRDGKEGKKGDPGDRGPIGQKGDPGRDR